MGKAQAAAAESADDDIVWVRNTTKTLRIMCDDKRTRLGPGPHPVKRALWEQACARAKDENRPNKGMALMIDLGELVELDHPAEPYATTLSSAEVAMLKGKDAPPNLEDMDEDRALMTVAACGAPKRLREWAKDEMRKNVKKAIGAKLTELKKLSGAADSK